MIHFLFVFIASAFCLNQAKKFKWFDFNIFPLGTKNFCALAILLHTNVISCPYSVTFIAFLKGWCVLVKKVLFILTLRLIVIATVGVVIDTVFKFEETKFCS